MYDWSGIRTHASEETSALNWRLGPLGHPTLRVHRLVEASGCTAAESSNGKKKIKQKQCMIGVGFEPTPPKRPVPETGALDRSAIQPWIVSSRI